MIEAFHSLQQQASVPEPELMVAVIMSAMDVMGLTARATSARQIMRGRKRVGVSKYTQAQYDTAQQQSPGSNAAASNAAGRGCAAAYHNAAGPACAQQDLALTSNEGERKTGLHHAGYGECLFVFAKP